MKFKTFKRIVTTVAVLGGVAVCAPCFIGDAPEQKQPISAVDTPPVATGPVPLRPLDREIAKLLGSPATQEKVKDAFGGKWKVNLYRDEGKRCFNRAKVDLDRDEKWDEKWSVAEDCSLVGLAREVAANDDERYDTQWILAGDEWRPEGAALPESPAPAAPNAPAPTGQAPETTPNASIPPRPIDREIFELLRTPRTADKAKDALPGAMKVNLYGDDKTRRCFDRVKIDYDRDEKWDEKWIVAIDCSPNSILRDVSTNDDESYDQRWLGLGGQDWRRLGAVQPKGGAPASTPATPTAPEPAAPAPAALASGATPLRAIDQQVLARVSQDITGDKVKDAIPGTAKVNLYKDAGQAKVNRLKIDLDRDEKWDEKWDFEVEGGEQKVKRHVAPADDEQYTEEYRLEGGAWKRK
jgi:hypothetical protein